MAAHEITTEMSTNVATERCNWRVVPATQRHIVAVPPFMIIAPKCVVREKSSLKGTVKHIAATDKPATITLTHAVMENCSPRALVEFAAADMMQFMTTIHNFVVLERYQLNQMASTDAAMTKRTPQVRTCVATERLWKRPTVPTGVAVWIRHTPIIPSNSAVVISFTRRKILGHTVAEEAHMTIQHRTVAVTRCTH